MKTITVNEIKDNVGKEIKLQGWVRNYRTASKKLYFIVFRDGTGETQGVAYKPDIGEESFKKVETLMHQVAV